MPQSKQPLQDASTATEVNPRDALNLKKAKIQILEGELSEIDAKLDAEFIEAIPTMLSEEEMDMRLDEDVRQFLALIEEKREAFYREKLDVLKSNIDTLRQEAMDEEENLDIEDGKRVFLEAHPEADWDALTDFYNNDIPLRQKEEFVGLDLVAFMEKVYELYSKKNKKTPPAEPAKEEATPPPNMNDAPSSPPKGDPTLKARDEGYLSRIGLRK